MRISGVVVILIFLYQLHFPPLPFFFRAKEAAKALRKVLRGDVPRHQMNAIIVSGGKVLDGILELFVPLPCLLLYTPGGEVENTSTIFF